MINSEVWGENVVAAYFIFSAFFVVTEKTTNSNTVTSGWTKIRVQDFMNVKRES